ncbi:MAG: nucleotidyltransferase domain-containing protein [Elusimicrobia bacterium]|nr:nucleotidyltransferase domain-containing protein [Elusimicrobiota bacterium]
MKSFLQWIIKKGIFCPEPAAFLLHKCVAFIDRNEKEKQAKDLYYAYFILRYAPEKIFKDIKKYNKKIRLKVFENIKKHFNFKSPNVCIMIERECGNDCYIEDLRGDIFERFNKFAEILK